MKNLKIVALALLLAASTTFIFAQQDQPQQRQQRERQTAEQRAESATKNLVEKLKLSDEQSEKVLNINLANFQKMDSMMMNNNGNSQNDNRRETMMKLMESNTAEIKTVLTEDQAAAYDKMLEEQAKQRQQRSQGGDRPQRNQQ